MRKAGHWLHTFLFILILVAPTIIRPPPGEAMVSFGHSLVIECQAIGIPPPLIVWRLNWGHIGQPPRISTTTEYLEGQFGGPTISHGKIVIESALKEDEGAYTCEAINSKGNVLAVSDTIVHVIRKLLELLSGDLSSCVRASTILNPYIMLLAVCVRTLWQFIILSFLVSCQSALTVVCLRLILTLVVKAQPNLDHPLCTLGWFN